MPWRARKATRFPRNVPITYAADGSPNGVLTWRSSRSVSSAMSYRPLPPMIPIVMDIEARLSDGSQDPALHLFLSQLDEHAVGARGMDECDPRAVRAGPGLVVDQPDAARFQAFQRGGEIVDAERDVVKPGTAFRKVLRNRGIAGGRFQQLERRPSAGKEMSGHPRGGHCLRRLYVQAKRVPI